jgi:hypothetical protein
MELDDLSAWRDPPQSAGDYETKRQGEELDFVRLALL